MRQSTDKEDEKKGTKKTCGKFALKKLHFTKLGAIFAHQKM